MSEFPRSLPLAEWPHADRRAWREACRPGLRLNPGGRASHLREVSREDYENRYGAFLGFLQRANLLRGDGVAAGRVTPANVEAYLGDLRSRVSSVTAYNCISKLRRVASLIAPDADFKWLSDIENDLALVLEPRSKFERFVFTEVLVEAGLTLVTEAQQSAKDSLSRARGVRNGLMIAQLALCPIRLKNFAGLTIGKTFISEQGNWWITLPRKTTKTSRPDERRVPELLYPAIDVYLGQSRPTLIGKASDTNALWISSRTGRAMTKKNLGTLISKNTLATVGVDVSPHLFRTAGVSTAAMLAGDLPHLGTALLGHTDPRIAEEHYRRVSSINAAKVYAEIIRDLDPS
jgi:integrase